MTKYTTKPQAKILSETEAMQQRILALAEMKEEQEQQGATQACKVVGSSSFQVGSLRSSLPRIR